jgi:hypothetical protein
MLGICAIKDLSTCLRISMEDATTLYNDLRGPVEVQLQILVVRNKTCLEFAKRGPDFKLMVFAFTLLQESPDDIGDDIEKWSDKKVAESWKAWANSKGAQFKTVFIGFLDGMLDSSAKNAMMISDLMSKGPFELALLLEDEDQVKALDLYFHFHKVNLRKKIHACSVPFFVCSLIDCRTKATKPLVPTMVDKIFLFGR